jgi:hypothetical protein
MSIYGHFTQQYYGNKINFPKESFLISGISFNKENCSNITYDTELNMKCEPDNIYDQTAIAVMNNDKRIGYIPNNATIKKLCKNNITEPLKVINIKKIKGNYGIRVIPERFYVHDAILENKVFFSDE